MEEYNHIFPNLAYVSTTEANLKVLELVFGGGAWGVVAANQLALMSGAFTYFLWAALTCWVLTLASYILQLIKRPKPSSNGPKEPKNAPRSSDIVMNLFFFLIYSIGLIVFSIYAVAKEQWNNSVAIVVIVMGFLTLVIHMIHASTVLTMCLMGKKRWQGEREWIWEGLFKPKSARQRNYTAQTSQSTTVHSPTKINITVANETRTPQGSNVSISSPMSQSHGSNAQQSAIDAGHSDVIYEDVPVEKGGQMQYYNYNESNNKENENTEVKKSEEDGAYLNPVFSSSSSQMQAT